LSRSPGHSLAPWTPAFLTPSPPADRPTAWLAAERQQWRAKNAATSELIELTRTEPPTRARPPRRNYPPHLEAEATCLHRYLETFHTLLARGADPNGSANHRPRQRRGSAWPGQWGRVEWTPLTTAVQCGNATVAALLFAAGADPNLPNSRKGTPLGGCAVRGDPAMAAALLARPNIDADAVSYWKCGADQMAGTPIVLSVLYGRQGEEDASVTRLLLLHRPALTRHSIRVALAAALSRGRWEEAVWLTACGADTRDTLPLYPGWQGSRARRVLRAGQDARTRVQAREASRALAIADGPGGARLPESCAALVAAYDAPSPLRTLEFACDLDPGWWRGLWERWWQDFGGFEGQAEPNGSDGSEAE
jgi:hypothetical protein